VCVFPFAFASTPTFAFSVRVSVFFPFSLHVPHYTLGRTFLRFRIAFGSLLCAGLAERIAVLQKRGADLQEQAKLSAFGTRRGNYGSGARPVIRRSQSARQTAVTEKRGVPRGPGTWNGRMKGFGGRPAQKNGPSADLTGCRWALVAKALL